MAAANPSQESKHRPEADQVHPTNTPDTDLEKQEVIQIQDKNQPKLIALLAVEDGIVYETHPEKNAKWYQRLLDVGFEENGIKPVPLEQRTATTYNNLFTIFFTSLLCLLP